MTALSAFIIPEVQSEIARHLSMRDLVACIQVCVVTREAFTPWLWRSLDLDLVGRSVRYPDKMEKFAQALASHGALVRRLICKSAGEQPHLLGLLQQVVPWACHRLTHLQLTIPESEESERWHSVLFQTNPGLTSVTLDNVEWLEPLIPNLLSRTASLSDLSLSFVDFVYWTPILAIVEQLPQLESLKIEGVYALSNKTDSTTVPRLSRQTKIRKLCLVFGSATSMLHYLLPYCPLLKHLQLQIRRSFVQELCLTLQSAPISLEYLTLCHDDKGSDKELAAILHAVPSSQLSRIHIQGCRAGERTLQVIAQHHGSTLRRLTVNSLRSITSQSVATILAQCPRLQEIEINNPRNHPDHFEPKTLLSVEWVCHELEIFRIPVSPSIQNDTHNDEKHTVVDTLHQVLRALPKIREIRTSCQCFDN
ncbi:hypothetical protein BGW42_007618 [Actinomortierella wolfii]|nr:hypothetical protein BGW42_007618 [Actinomortierella wolfii]